MKKVNVKCTHIIKFGKIILIYNGFLNKYHKYSFDIYCVFRNTVVEILYLKKLAL